MDKIQRRYPRVSLEQPATVILREMVLFQDRVFDASIYQLGAQGCGLIGNAKDFENNQNIYLKILDPLGSSALQIRARVVWKSPEDEDAQCHYGLEFLWIKKEAGEELDDPVTQRLNYVLRPTGYSLMQK